MNEQEEFQRKQAEGKKLDIRRKVSLHHEIVSLMMDRAAENAVAKDVEAGSPEMYRLLHDWTVEHRDRTLYPLGEGIQRLQDGRAVMGLEINAEGHIENVLTFSCVELAGDPKVYSYGWNDDLEVVQSEVKDLRIDRLHNQVKLLFPDDDFVHQYIPWLGPAADDSVEPFHFVTYWVQLNADSFYENYHSHLQMLQRPDENVGQVRDYTTGQGYMMLLLAEIGCPFELETHPTPRSGLLLQVRFHTNNEVALQRALDDLCRKYESIGLETKKAGSDVTLDPNVPFEDGGQG